jgi:hypothetical protein
MLEQSLSTLRGQQTLLHDIVDLGRVGMLHLIFLGKVSSWTLGICVFSLDTY